jgi:hypothetical protein
MKLVQRLPDLGYYIPRVNRGITNRGCLVQGILFAIISKLGLAWSRDYWSCIRLAESMILNTYLLNRFSAHWHGLVRLRGLQRYPFSLNRTIFGRGREGHLSRPIENFTKGNSS